jgi:hypothetical protein
VISAFQLLISDGISINPKQQNQTTSSFFGGKNQVVNRSGDFGDRVESQKSKTNQQQTESD